MRSRKRASGTDNVQRDPVHREISATYVSVSWLVAVATVESILFAWHEVQISGQLEHLAEVRDRAGGDPGERLQAVPEAYV